MRDGREKREGEGRTGRRGGVGEEGRERGENGVLLFLPFCGNFFLFFPFSSPLGEGMRVGIFCTVHLYAFENLGHVSSPFHNGNEIY